MLTLGKKKKIQREKTIKDPLFQKNLHQSSIALTEKRTSNAFEEFMTLVNSSQAIDNDYQVMAKNYLDSVSKWSKTKQQQLQLDESESDSEVKAKKRKRETVSTTSTATTRAAATTQEEESSSAPVRKYKRKTTHTPTLKASKDQSPIVEMLPDDLLNKETGIDQTALDEEIEKDVSVKIIKLKASHRKLVENKDHLTPQQRENMEELDQQIKIIQDKSKPLKDQQLYYPINTKLLQEQEKILKILSNSAGNNTANLTEFIRSYDSAALRDMNNSFVMKFVRQYQPESFLHQSKDFHSVVGRRQVNPPKRLREDEEGFLFAPRPGSRDRYCRYGRDCQGTKVPDAPPVILREYLTKEERQMGDALLLPEEPRRCAMCNRHDIAKDHMTIRSTADDIKGAFCIQNYCNEVNVEGEYDLRQCFMSSSTDYQGMPKPVVIHCLYWYSYVVKDGVPGFEQTGYIRYTAQDNFWKNMDGRVKDFLRGLVM